MAMPFLFVFSLRGHSRLRRGKCGGCPWDPVWRFSGCFFAKLPWVTVPGSGADRIYSTYDTRFGVSSVPSLQRRNKEVPFFVLTTDSC